MKTVAAQGMCNTWCGFILKVKDEDFEEAKELAHDGLFAWLGNESLREERFPELSYNDDYWYATGYTEPTIELLRRNGITDYILEPCFDACGEWLKEFENINVDAYV